MVLVIGATGLLGGEVCRRLAAAGKPVRAMVRPTADATRMAALRALGAELVTGDLKDRASIDAACRGVDAIITTASTTFSRQSDDTIDAVDRAGQLLLVAAARNAGVPRFVYVSVSGKYDVDCPLVTAKRAVEGAVIASGMTYTILRPTAFMEIWLSPAVGFDVPNARAQIYGSGRNRISYISFKDVAQFAVASLDNPAARNAIIELGGPEAVSPLDVVRTFETVTGRRFEVQHVPEEALEAQRAAATDPLQQSFAALMLVSARGDAIEMDATLRKFPERLTSVREFADSFRPAEQPA